MLSSILNALVFLSQVDCGLLSMFLFISSSTSESHLNDVILLSVILYVGVDVVAPFHRIWMYVCQL